jgi:hypothetical protein
MDTISSKESLLKVKLLEFYKDQSNLDILLPIINQQTRLSLRSLDWFVTNYCKKHNINYSLEIDGSLISYFPFKRYKSQLKAYSKKFCDPFCRRERVIFDYRNNTITDFKSNIKIGHKEYIITTIGQLNFFRFAIQDSIIDYAINHIQEIENDMNNTLKTRKELSVPGNKSVHITRYSAVIKFV